MERNRGKSPVRCLKEIQLCRSAHQLLCGGGNGKNNFHCRQ